MIISFGDKTTEDLYNGVNSKASRKIPTSIIRTAVRKLDMIDSAYVLNDLSVPPANNLKLLKGNLKGFYSIRINDQYRIIFKWLDGNATEVKITDYH